MRYALEPELAQVRLEAQARVSRLSALEAQVLFLLAEGYSGAKIAATMRIPNLEVELLRRAMMANLGANCTADAVRIALLAGSVRKFTSPD